MFAEGFGVGGLVDADGAEAAAFVVGDVGADPSDFVGHLFVADAGRDGGGLLEFFLRAPAVGALDDVGFHGFYQVSRGGRKGCGRRPASYTCRR